MTDLTTSLDARAALAIHAVLAIAVVAAILVVAALVREKRAKGAGLGLYESGAPGVAPAAHMVPTTYFLVAAAFVIFDLEAAILFAWAVAAPAAGWPGLVSAAIFVAILLAALVYLWADGALEVGPRRPVGGARRPNGAEEGR